MFVNLSYDLLVAYFEYWQQPLLETFLQPLRWGEICIHIYKQTKCDSKQHKTAFRGVIPVVYIRIMGMEI